MPRKAKTEATENTEIIETAETTEGTTEPKKKRVGHPRKLPDPDKMNKRPISEKHKAKEKAERAEILKEIDEMTEIGRFPEWHTQFSNLDEPVTIDREQFEKLCAIFCTADEIAGWFYCGLASLQKWCMETYGCSFSEIYEKLSMRGHISLRRLLLHHAARNPVMSIFLAKNYLGMKDNPDDNSQAEIIAHLDEIKTALLEASKNPVIDADTGMVYDAEYAEAHAEDTAPVGKAIEVDENAD